MYLSKWLERVLASGKMGGEDHDDQEGELMSEQDLDLDLEGDLTDPGDRQEEEVMTKHWAVKAATSIALLFKVRRSRIGARQERELLSSGRLHRIRHPLSVGSQLPWHRDILGSRLRPPLDTRLLLLHLDLSCTPALYGDQEV